jgi:hypothetical protein
MVKMYSREARRAILEGGEFPDGLRVDGALYLRDCTGLAALPEGRHADYPAIYQVAETALMAAAAKKIEVRPVKSGGSR